MTHLLSFLIFVSFVEIVEFSIDKFLIVKLSAGGEILMIIGLSSIFSFLTGQIHPVDFRFSARAHPDFRFSIAGFCAILKFSIAGFSPILQFSSGEFRDIKFSTGGFRDIKFLTAGFGDIEFSIDQLVDHQTLLLRVAAEQVARPDNGDGDAVMMVFMFDPGFNNSLG